MFTVPVGEWFCREKTEYCVERFTEIMALDGLIDIKQANVLLAQHVNGSSNNTREIRALISLTHWIAQS